MLYCHGVENKNYTLFNHVIIPQKWIVECVCFIYSEWDITRHELRQKTNFADESIQGCLAETDPVIRTNRTSELLPLLLKQHTLLGDKVDYDLGSPDQMSSSILRVKVCTITSNYNGHSQNSNSA